MHTAHGTRQQGRCTELQPRADDIASGPLYGHRRGSILALRLQDDDSSRRLGAAQAVRRTHCLAACAVVQCLLSSSSTS